MSDTASLSYEQRHIARANLWFLITYWLHVPVLTGIALYQGSGFGLILGASLAAVAGPTVLYLFNRHSLLTACSMGLGGIALSAVLIHLGGGMIEMHFHIFVLLPLLAFFGSPWVVLCGAAMAAVHHVAFYFFLPTSLFNYSASLWIVALHALFVVLATAPGLFLARLIHAYVIGTGDALVGLSSAGADLTQSSRELSSASSSLATEANSQAAAVQDISSTIAEIETRTSQVSQSLGQTRDVQLTQVQAVLTQIESAGTRLTTTISGIRESSEAITKIAKGIEEIAFQTNILALNAAVEAARAGEAGAGFAVVAGEVRALAARAADSARETTSLIESAAERGRAGEAVSAEVSRHLSQVLGSFRELDAVIRRAASDVAEQSRGVTQISTAMQQIDANAQTSSARSEELSATAAALREQSDVVTRSIQSLAKVTGTIEAPAPEPAPARTPPVAVAATSRVRAKPAVAAAHFR
ncbi:MAG TPA: methyl-accepting chemotaxis protein [Opitutaceae bacterium]